jgi:hypothetical protein
MGSPGGLRGKVRKTSEPLERLLQRATAETEILRIDCLEHLGESIRALRSAVDAAGTADALDGRQLDYLAADIQGIAANFGFVFVARLAGLLRGEIAQRRLLPTRERAVIEAYVKALAAAHARGGEADGDQALYQALLKALGALSRRERAASGELS